MLFRKKYDINIAILGTVSAGKTTLLNGLFSEQYSDMKIKRTTMIPQIYHSGSESVYRDDNGLMTADQILINNRQYNEILDKKTINDNKNITAEDIEELEYHVPKIPDFVELHENINLTVYDLPGINDSQTKSIYTEYLTNNFHRFDIIIWLIDVITALNTSDEMDIMKLIVDSINNNNRLYNITTKLLIVVNKCDDIIELIDCENGPKFASDDNTGLYEQIQDILKSNIKDIPYDICPISCESLYIYRMLKNNPDHNIEVKYLDKFGHGEYGKQQWNNLQPNEKKQHIHKFTQSDEYNKRICTSGFINFSSILQHYLDDCYTLVTNRLKYQIRQVNASHFKHIDAINTNTDSVNIFYNIWNEINTISQIFNTDSTNIIFIRQMFFEKLHECTIEYNKIVLDLMIVNSLYIDCDGDNDNNTDDGNNDNFVQIQKIPECVISLTNKFESNTVELVHIYDNILKQNITYDKLIKLFHHTSFDEQTLSYITSCQLYRQLLTVIYGYNIWAALDNNNVLLTYNNIEVPNLSYKLHNIDVLIHFKYIEWRRILQLCILEDSNKFTEKSVEQQIEFLDIIKKKYELNNIDFINLIFSLLDKIYSKYTVCMDTKYFYKLQFWSNIMIKSSNRFFNIISGLKHLFNKLPLIIKSDDKELFSSIKSYTDLSNRDNNYNNDNNDNNDNKNNISYSSETVLEYYLLETLKKSYPLEIYTIDENIEILNANNK